MTDATPYRDTSGRALSDYPRPSVAVDTALLTVPAIGTDWGDLSLLLTRTKDAAAGVADTSTEEWRLPGTFLHEGERLSDAVLRSLRDKAGIEGLHPRQLRVFDAPGRDNRGWVLSVAHLDAVPADRIRLTGRTRLAGVDQVPRLQYDHDDIVTVAADVLRDEYRRAPDPYRLLPEREFTMRDLRMLHEAVLGERLVADTFRRTMLPGLRPTGTLRRGARGKPAELFALA
ncbi:MAG TPA: NUDIX hydrolase [Terrimesophilobacter sp.]|nr:NUDIX hydrolase [Terrimesophilobacter sp.]